MERAVNAELNFKYNFFQFFFKSRGKFELVVLVDQFNKTDKRKLLLITIFYYPYSY